MSTGISINKHIYSILSSDNDLKKMLDKKIYPLVAEEVTTFPFLIFKRDSLNVSYTKDGNVHDMANIAVAIATKSYNQAVDIAERVRKLLELKRDDVILRSTLSSVSEDYIDDSYIIEMNFEIILN